MTRTRGPRAALRAAGLTNCGASSESCCASLEVTGDTYYRTYDLDAYGNPIGPAVDGGPTGEADPATISGFRLDKYLVTVGRFRNFVSAWNSGWTPKAACGKHTHLNGGQGLVNSGGPGTFEPGWVTSDNGNVAPTNANLACSLSSQTWTASAGSNENLPVNCANWWESYAFCIWDGGFLPSETEWEYAAAGGSQQRYYPWGATDPGASSQYAIYGGYYMANPTNIAPVGSAMRGAALWGQLDLAGNVQEWNLDWSAAYVDPCADCAYLSAASFRVFRGGNFYDGASSLPPPKRAGYFPTARGQAIGVRCARVP